MSEITSPKPVSITEIKIDKPVSNTGGNSRALSSNVPEKETQIRLAGADMYNSSPKAAIQPNQTPLNQSPSFLLMSSIYSKITNPFINMQENFNGNKQAVFDISDKLAAIYGEKEKDIKDKLSDSFKKLILIPFNLVSEVDTAMGQKEHNKEKKLKDREPENSIFEIKPKKKEFSLRQWINYKLLEIAGEILNFSRKFTTALRQKNKKLKIRVYKGFKKIKGEIIYILDTIDSLSKPEEKITKEPEIKNLFKQ